MIESKNIASRSNVCFDYTRIGHLDSTSLPPCQCDRLWCGSTTSAWAISVFLFTFSLILLLVSYLIKMKKKNAVKNGNENEMDTDAKRTEQGTTLSENSLVDDTNSDVESGSQNKFGTDQSQTLANDPSKKEYLKSIGVARFLASQHIVIGHLYAKGATSNTYFFSFGFTWVPWFFLLSGFVLTHARMNSSNLSNVDGPYNHIAKRLSTIYPMYAFGVILTMVIRLGKNAKLPGFDVLIAQSYLLQSWIPILTERALLSQCWFLSNLIVYWACFSQLYRFVNKMTLHQTSVSLLLICCLPWLVVIVPALDGGIELDWYRAHQWGQFERADDIWTVLLKFHPIFYLHVFVFGMLLAVLREHLKQNSTDMLASALRGMIRFGACIGYIILILIFSIEEIKPPARKLSTRLSILLPAHGLIMLGLSPLPQTTGLCDPLALLFSYAPTWIGDVVRTR